MLLESCIFDIIYFFSLWFLLYIQTAKNALAIVIIQATRNNGVNIPIYIQIFPESTSGSFSVVYFFFVTFNIWLEIMKEPLFLILKPTFVEFLPPSEVSVGTHSFPASEKVLEFGSSIEHLTCVTVFTSSD